MVVWGGATDFAIAGDGGRYGIVLDSDINDTDGDLLVDVCDTCPLDAANDQDRDAICGNVDTCPLFFDPCQADSDLDGLGDACDPCTDPDHDGFGNPGFPATNCLIDNCPTTYNPEQQDQNSNGVGNACEVGSGPYLRQIFVSRERKHFECTNRVELCFLCIPDIIGRDVVEVDLITVRAQVADPDGPDDLQKVKVKFIDPPECPASPPLFGIPTLVTMDLFDNGRSDISSAPGLQLSGDDVAGDSIYSRQFYFRTQTDRVSGCVEATDQSNIGGSLGIYVSPLYSEPADMRDFRFFLEATDRESNSSGSSEFPIAVQGTFVSLSDFSRACGPPPGCASLPNEPPRASIVAKRESECSSPSGAPVLLDGSESSDPNSTPGTNDDLISFEWFKDFGLPSSALLGKGPVLITDLPLGDHDITLQVTDLLGTKATAQEKVGVSDTVPPNLVCPSPQSAECSGSTGTRVNSVASAIDRCSPSVAIQNNVNAGGGDASGDYPLGTTAIHFTASDASGNTSSCDSSVTVRDTTPPILAVSPAPSVLWPPNHRMVDIGIGLTSTDACSTPTVTLSSITSTEPDDAPGSGDGSTVNDIRGADLGDPDFSFQLRAERESGGGGRVYQLTYTAVDSSGNQASTSSIVLVPHDKGASAEPLFVSVENRAPGTELRWNPVPGASNYKVIRGVIGNLREAGEIIDLGTVSCNMPASSSTSTAGFEDADVPALGKAFFYLVSYNDGRDSGYGSTSTAKPRAETGGGCE
jgi:hypothetical protein